MCISVMSRSSSLNGQTRTNSSNQLTSMFGKSYILPVAGTVRYLKLVNHQHYVVFFRAIGLVNVLVMLPFEERLRHGSILDLNQDLELLYSTVESWSKDGSSPLTCETTIFRQPLTSTSMFHVNRTFIVIFIILHCLCRCLLSPTEDPVLAVLDGLTKVAIELICLEMTILIERQAESQLPGGQYWKPTEKQKHSAANVPKTNVVGERDMAVLDNLLHQKPGRYIKSFVFSH